MLAAHRREPAMAVMSTGSDDRYLLIRREALAGGNTELDQVRTARGHPSDCNDTDWRLEVSDGLLSYVCWLSEVFRCGAHIHRTKRRYLPCSGWQTFCPSTDIGSCPLRNYRVLTVAVGRRTVK
jgi:hypothetical protein